VAAPARTSVPSVDPRALISKKLSRQLAEEAEHAPPGVLAGRGVLFERAVEERVRRARIAHELVLHAGRVERRVVLVDLLLRDVVVGAAEEPEHGAARLTGGPDRRRPVRPLGQPAVEAHDPGQPERLVGRGQERVRAAEAEADRHHPLRTGARAQQLDRRGGVGLHLLDARLLHVLHVVELLVALAEPGGAAEVVDRDRAVARLREPLGELDVEAVEAAHVGEDHHRGIGGLRRWRERRREPCAVGRLELDLLGRGAARDGPQREVGRQIRRAGVEREAHVRSVPRPRPAQSRRPATG
jgi:hypothetical protein